ncbi:MAG: tRNA pseudouridine(55) synthase TruB [Gammaproteobacteria bacterium]|nr:tRNA pseudouridine(55) synthase TruB [Gammaproteobacteria bacterium]
MSRRNRKGRSLNGILLLDKPAGAGSNAVLQRVKWLYCAKKAGHTGSLDPLATGLLPICFGEATKFSRFLLDADKSYDATIFLGASSSTQDADGELTFVADANHLQQTQVADAVAAVAGRQLQKPPMYSALKHEGQRLYKLARQGVQVDIPEREVSVYSITPVSFRAGVENPAMPGKGIFGAELVIRLQVSKGTYVRSIAEKIGSLLGVGGYITALRRTAVVSFDIEQAVSLQRLEQLSPVNLAATGSPAKLADFSSVNFAEIDELLLAIPDALPHLPPVTLDQNSSFYLLRGNPVQVAGAPLSGEVKILLDTGEFVGVGEIDDSGRVAPKRLVAS